MVERAHSETAVERYTIFPIPAEERHGTAKGLFTLWFGVNLHVLTIVSGGLATKLFGLPLLPSIVAIIVGNVFGGIFMALHAAQGPQLGVPQMIQSRGQFGSIGAIVVVLLAIVMYLGFVASNFVLGAQSLGAILPLNQHESGIVAIAALSGGIAIFGHDLLQACERWVTAISGLAVLACFVWIFAVVGTPANLWTVGKVSTEGFLGMVAVGALWQIAYAPYVSDYTRYLPVDSGARQAFWSSYWGCVLGTILPMLLGALLGVTVRERDLVAGLLAQLGPIAAYVVVAFSIGMVCASSVNIYCCALTVITAGQTVASDWRPGRRARIVVTVALVAIAATMATAGAESFLVTYEHFLSLLLCVMAPWTAINLTDFYLLKHGRYDVASFFAADGGIYGRFNWIALACFVIGIVVQLPFVSTKILTGPLAKAMGGVDISWLIGLSIPAVLYIWLVRLSERATAARSGASEMA